MCLTIYIPPELKVVMHELYEGFFFFFFFFFFYRKFVVYEKDTTGCISS